MILTDNNVLWQVVYQRLRGDRPVRAVRRDVPRPKPASDGRLRVGASKIHHPQAVSSGTATVSLMSACVFCTLPGPRFVCANALAFAICDTSPVTPLHYLILPRRHVSSYFDVGHEERDAMHQLLEQVRRGISAQDPTVAGFNIGINVGE